MVNPNTISEVWDSTAEAYDKEFAPFFESFAIELVELAGVKTGQRVLDIAAGTGIASVAAARKGAKVTAIDFSPGMLALFDKRKKALKVSHVMSSVMDGQALKFPDGSFDVAFSNFGLIFFPDRAKGLNEMYRVLKPGGTAAVSAWKKVALVSPIDEAMFQVLPNLPRPKGPSLALSLKDPAVFKHEMEQAGFKHLQITDVVRVWKSKSAEEHWERLNPVSRSLQQLKVSLKRSEWDAIRGRAIDIVRSEFGTGAIEIPAEAYIGVGTKG